MSKVVMSINQDDIGRLSGWSDVDKLSSKEDVATFIDTFENSEIKGSSVVKILGNGKYYIFVTDNNVNDFDFSEKFKLLCEAGGLKSITVNNAKLICPLTLSRKYFVEEDSVVDAPEYEDTGEIVVDTDSEEAPTGFMGDSDIPEDILQEINDSRRLIHIESGSKLPINDSHGVIIGRSSAQSEFTVPNSKVSRKHARVYKQGNRYMVHDYDSANGTYIDGLRVRSDLDREIPVGSMLILGDEEFRLV